MRQFKKIFFLALACLLLMETFTSYALAAETAPVSVETMRFADGSYLVKKVSASPATRAAKTISGQATYNYYSATNLLLWTAWVNGSFTYNGASATATAASCGYTIHESVWSLKDSNAYCSGNQAIADMTFQGPLFFSRSITLTLTCSPDGKLS